jgi:hypothetical protein
MIECSQPNVVMRSWVAAAVCGRALSWSITTPRQTWYVAYGFKNVKLSLFTGPWRPIGLWDFEVPTFSRQSAHRWRWGIQP